MATTFTAATKFTAIDKFSGVVNKMSATTKAFSASAHASFAKAERATRSFISSANTLQSKIFNLRNAAGVMFAGMAIRSIWNATTKLAEMGDEASKTARMIGITAEYLQEMRFAADRQGVSSETLTKGFVLLNRNIGDLQMGQGTLTTMLKRTNPALLKQMQSVSSNEEAFSLLSEAIQKAPNQMQKAAMAQAAFGRSGVEMLKLLEAGPEGISKLREEARKYGGVMSNEAAKASEDFIDKQTNMKFAIEGLKMQIGVGLMPIVEKITVKITNWATANRELVKTRAAEFAESFGKKLKWVYDNGSTVLSVLKWLIGAMITLKLATMAASIVLGTIKTALFLYNVALGVTGALTGVVNVAVGKSAVALAAYKITLGIVTAAQWLWAAALNAGIWPILAVIAAVIAIVGILANFKSILGGLTDQWFAFIDAIKSGDILKAFKAIGNVIITSVLLPFKGLLLGLSMIPGAVGKMAKSAVVKMDALKFDVSPEESKTKPLNPDATATSVTTQRIEKTSNQKLNINVKADPGTQANVNGSKDLTPFISNTLAWQR